MNNAYDNIISNMKTNINTNNLNPDQIYFNNLNEDNNLQELEDEFELVVNNINIPKNNGKLWNKKDRQKIIKMLNKNNIINNIFTDKIIFEIANKLERSDNSIRNEIKKIIFNKYLEGKDNEEISKELNIDDDNINLIIKLYNDQEINKYILYFEKQNKLLKLKLENCQLRNELKKLN